MEPCTRYTRYPDTGTRYTRYTRYLDIGSCWPCTRCTRYCYLLFFRPKSTDRAIECIACIACIEHLLQHTPKGLNPLRPLTLQASVFIAADKVTHARKLKISRAYRSISRAWSFSRVEFEGRS